MEKLKPCPFCGAPAKKGRYVAQVEINFDIERLPGMSSLDDMVERLRNGEYTKALQREMGEMSAESVTLTQQYADLYEVNDGE